jgi:PAS domain S-box-containing protein
MTNEELITQLANTQRELAAAQARIAELEAALSQDHTRLTNPPDLRNQTQERLREDGESFRVMVKNVEDYAIYLLDLDGTVTSWNIGAERLEGYQSDDIIGQHFSRFFTPEDVQAGKPQQLLATALSQGRVEDEGWRVRKDGERFWTNVVITTLYKEDGTPYGFAKIARDVTERRQAAEEREHLLAEAIAAHDLLTSVFERMSDGIVALDKDGNYTYVSQPAVRLLNRQKPEDLIGKNIWIEFPEVVGQAFDHAFHRAIETQQVISLETYYEPWDRWFENRIYPSPDGVTIYFTETTERKRAEAAVQRYNRHLTVIRQIEEDIIAARSPEKIMEAVLNNVRELIPCDRAAVMILDEETEVVTVTAATPDPTSAIQPNAHFPLNRGPMLEMLRSGENLRVPDLQQLDNVTSELIKVYIREGIRSALLSPLIVEGQFIGVLNLTSQRPDFFITEHVEIAQDLANQLAVALYQSRLTQRIIQQNAELEQRVAERTAQLEAKNRDLETFSYTVSHDLKAPLRGIDGYSRLLLEDHLDKLDEEGRSFLRNIRTAANQMGQLIDDLLTYSRLERRPLQTNQINPHSLAESLVAEYTAEIQQREVSLTLSIPPQATVSADPDGLTMALRNLLDNALKFTRQIEKPVIEIGGRETENTCILWVQDNGIGFDMKYHDRILEIFQRLHRVEEYPGTGIGLAIVKKAMQRMGGRIWAESELGKGATFYLEVPK